jgi:hypothetical protein
MPVGTERQLGIPAAGHNCALILGSVNLHSFGACISFMILQRKRWAELTNVPEQNEQRSIFSSNLATG